MGAVKNLTLRVLTNAKFVVGISIREQKHRNRVRKISKNGTVRRVRIKYKEERRTVQFVMNRTHLWHVLHESLLARPQSKTKDGNVDDVLLTINQEYLPASCAEH